jgi:SET domain-containing protein
MTKPSLNKKPAPFNPSSWVNHRLRKHASTIGLSVRTSRINGLGVFAIRALPPRRKLGEISGTLVKLPFARRVVERHPKIYLVELSSRVALDCSQGNGFTHLNHSCRPNCYLRVYLNRIEVYTLRKIPPGSELTVNYGVTPHVGGMACSCGSARCVGRL